MSAAAEAASDSSHAEAVREFRRARVLAAARAVFSEKGLQAGSVRAIASAAGCTTGAIYSQFGGGKKELYAEVLSASLTSLHADVAAAVAAASTDVERLRRAAEEFFAYYRERPNELALGLYLFQGAQAVALGRELDARLNGQLRDVLQILTAAVTGVGPASDAELETAALFTYLMGLLIVEQTRRVRVTQRDTEELLGHYIDALLGRLAADHPRAAEGR